MIEDVGVQEHHLMVSGCTRGHLNTGRKRHTIATAHKLLLLLLLMWLLLSSCGGRPELYHVVDDD